MGFGSIVGGIASSALGSALGGSSEGGGGGGRAEEFRLNNPNFSAIFDKTKGPDHIQIGPSGELLNLSNQQVQDSQGFFGQASNNANADQAGLLGGQFLNSLGGFDPAQIAQQQFDQLFPILDRIQQRDQGRLESRLFNQGQLGGTPGSFRTQDLLGSQADQRRKLLFDSFGQGLNARNQQFNIGSQLLQLDPTLRGLFQNLGNNSLQNVLNIQGTANDTFSAIAAAEGGGSSGGGGGGGLNASGQLGQGLLNSGIGGITGGINSLFSQGGRNVGNPFGSGGGSFGNTFNT